MGDNNVICIFFIFKNVFPLQAHKKGFFFFGGQLGYTRQICVCIDQITTRRLFGSFKRFLSLSFVVAATNNNCLSLALFSLSRSTQQRSKNKRRMGRLATLSEEPINEEDDATNGSKKGVRQTWRNWIKTHISLVFNKRSDIKILLSVLGCPLFPVSVHPKLCLNEVNYFQL